MNDETETMTFSSREEYRDWLSRNHSQDIGIWIVFEKGNKQFTSTMALEESICFGWIDGIIKRIDSMTYQKYFSRRKNRENWSEKNRRLYETLLQDGKIVEAGIEAYRPIESKKSVEVSINEKVEILRSVLNDEMEVTELYDQIAKSRQKQLAGFYCEAKSEETKKKRKDKIIEALKSNYKGMLY